MLRDLLGIRQDPKLPAFAAAEVRPLVPASLDWAEGHLDTPRGRIRVRWQRQDGQPHVEITAPPGTAEQ
ncbi:MAG: alpha-L-rhamnosidase C-terminal domain-containing protein [Phycisphaerae bacterium]